LTACGVCVGVAGRNDADPDSAAAFEPKTTNKSGMGSLALYLTTFTFYAVATGIHLSPTLLLTLVLVCTITAIFLPNWLVYNSTQNLDVHITYGLTKHCSSYPIKPNELALIR
jgi:hypothetical protein